MQSACAAMRRSAFLSPLGLFVSARPFCLRPAFLSLPAAVPPGGVVAPVPGVRG